MDGLVLISIGVLLAVAFVLIHLLDQVQEARLERDEYASALNLLRGEHSDDETTWDFPF